MGRLSKRSKAIKRAWETRRKNGKKVKVEAPKVRFCRYCGMEI